MQGRGRGSNGILLVATEGGKKNAVSLEADERMPGAERISGRWCEFELTTLGDPSTMASKEPARVNRKRARFASDNVMCMVRHVQSTPFSPCARAHGLADPPGSPTTPSKSKSAGDAESTPGPSMNPRAPLLLRASLSLEGEAPQARSLRSASPGEIALYAMTKRRLRNPPGVSDASWTRLPKLHSSIWTLSAGNLAPDDQNALVEAVGFRFLSSKTRKKILAGIAKRVGFQEKPADMT